MAQLRYSPLPRHYSRHTSGPHVIKNLFPAFAYTTSISLKQKRNPISHLDFQTKLAPPHAAAAAGGGGDITGGNNRGRRGGGGNNGGGEDSDEPNKPVSIDGFSPISAFINGWRSRVLADPQFPFKVLMEEIVGVSACVLGDMASRPNFGLNELDFVFSTLVVGSIMNFVLMYLLAPTISASIQKPPSFFAGSPTSHMFEPGPYTLLGRFGTFVYKGVVFGAVGFTAGLVGTVISNGMIAVRKKMEPSFETPNKAPPAVLNAVTWAGHVGISCNLRYQTLNGIEYVLGKGLLPSVLFKTCVVVLRCVNNVVGGMSFVVLARLTGSQSVDELDEKKQKLLMEVVQGRETISK